MFRAFTQMAGSQGWTRYATWCSIKHLVSNKIMQAEDGHSVYQTGQNYITSLTDFTKDINPKHISWSLQWKQHKINFQLPTYLNHITSSPFSHILWVHVHNNTLWQNWYFNLCTTMNDINGKKYMLRKLYETSLYRSQWHNTWHRQLDACTRRHQCTQPTQHVNYCKKTWIIESVFTVQATMLTTCIHCCMPCCSMAAAERRAAHTNTHTRSMALYKDYLGKPVPER